ncbi:MAG: hypothetical protein WBD83_12880 [Xanthobacteraceae bacterium]
MSDVAILYRRINTIVLAAQWLDRAARARGIAMMLSTVDAKVAEAYAAECEERVRRLIEEPRMLIAA